MNSILLEEIDFRSYINEEEEEEIIEHIEKRYKLNNCYDSTISSNWDKHYYNENGKKFLLVHIYEKGIMLFALN